MRVGGIMDVVAKENERAKTLVQRLGRWRRTELGEVGFGLHWGVRRRQWTTKLPWAQGVGGGGPGVHGYERSLAEAWN